MRDFQAVESSLTGSAQATGLSFVPTTASIFVRVTKYQFSDGTSQTVVSSDDAKVAGSDGDTSTVTGDGKLKLVPL